MNINTIKVSKLENVTITIQVTRGFRIRMAVGLWIMKIGVRITGAGVEIVEKPEA